MKTSSAQFEMMVTFMEQHGDLCKPTSSARGRICSARKWEELGSILNSDGGGTSKSTEKWKKVWSDYKNNTKKKAARLHRAACGTGGGPAIYSKLTELEQRVLSLIGTQVATGLAVEEAGLPQGLSLVQPLSQNQEPTRPSPVAEHYPIHLENFDNSLIVEHSQPWNEPGPSTLPHIAPPSSQASPPFMEGSLILNVPQARSLPLAFREPEEENDNVTPTSTQPESHSNEDNVAQLQPAHSGQTTPPSGRGRARRTPQNTLFQDNVAQQRPAISGQTTPRRGRGRARGTPWRLARPAHTELATQNFLHADEEWRKLKIKQHEDYMELRREQNRIRSMEVESQEKWQAVAVRALDLLDKLVSKYCNEPNA